MSVWLNFCPLSQDLLTYLLLTAMLDLEESEEAEEELDGTIPLHSSIENPE